MTQKDFVDTFVATWLASYAATHQTGIFAAEGPNWTKNLPVENAYDLAVTAWEQYQQLLAHKEAMKNIQES
jgi:hypothetical protein